jgi:hypothetical protein
MVWTRGLTAVVLVGIGVATACGGRSSGRSGGAGGSGASGGNGGSGGRSATGGSGGVTGGAGGSAGRQFESGGSAGGGGTAGRGGAGAGGRGGAGGFGGEIIDPPSCPDSEETFCDSLGWGDCPKYVDGAWRAECPEDADYATYEECDGQTMRYRWLVGSENDAEMVFDLDGGDPLYGTSSDWDGRSCTVGSTGELTGCRLCYVCRGITFEGEGGQAGAGNGADCVIDGEGRVSLPD